MTYVSGTAAQPATGKAALIARQQQGMHPPVQHEDSGMRFGEEEDQEAAGPSQVPNEVPPSYTPR